MDKEERSPEMVRLVYFLHRYGRAKPSGQHKPPSEFGEANKRAVYDQFFARLGGGREFKRFQGSAEGLRKGNIREHLEDGAAYLPKYEAILRTWQHLPRERQWADLQQYREVL